MRVLKQEIWKKNSNEEIWGTLDTNNSTYPTKLSEGSYCLIITVSRTENGNAGDGTVRTVMEVPYYFIIMDENSEIAWEETKNVEKAAASLSMLILIRLETKNDPYVNQKV